MYPVEYEAEHVERHSRLTTFFRSITQIPAALLTLVYLLAAQFAVIAAWFAIVFTGRYPQGIYDFVVGALRNWTRVTAYGYLVTDRYPPWDGAPHDEYPVRARFGPPLERYSRLSAAFRLILAIPVMIIAYVFQLIAGIAALCAWFVIVITGKLPKGLQDLIDMGVRYLTRANAYYFLVTERWPPLNDPPPTAAVGPAPTGPPVEATTGAYQPPAPPS